MTMRTAVRRAAVISVLMAAAACLAYVGTPRTPLVQSIGTLNLEQAVPKEFGGWRVEPTLAASVVNPQQEAFVKQIYSQTLSRTYVNADGRRVMLSVAYSEDQRRQSALHYPEVCYPAQGFSIRGKSTSSIATPGGSLGVKRLETVFNESRFEPLLYWVVVGDHHVEGSIAKKLALVRYGMQGLIADGFIFRVSSIGRDTGREYALQQQFVADLMQALPPSGRARLSGL